MSRHGKRIVLKFGSGILTRPGGAVLDPKQIGRLCSAVAGLVRKRHQCVIVTSGAVAAGMSAMQLAQRPRDLATCQASAAVGQSKLMRAYETAFARHKLNVAQLLLTHSDLDSRIRYANAKNTLERLLAAGDIVPVINENDSVAVEELKYGDNDRLSADVAMLAGADLLLILTQVDGLLDKTGRVVARVEDIKRVKSLATPSKGRLSVGGMISKLEAVEMAVAAGIPAIILNGRRPEAMAAAVRGENAGTRFTIKRGRGSVRRK
jgi:glutamate 5-kinase